MHSLELRLIGNLQVLRNDEPLPLPPSKKTRALLAYLALNSRDFPREHLCELLWEIPDDPRGSLRWSLSKIRKLIDSPDRNRIEASRSTVSLNIDDVVVDVLELAKLRDQMDKLGENELTDAINRNQGNFLEGMELSNFHTFNAWCISKREEVNQAQAALLEKLVSLLAETPEKALPWSRQLVTRVPYDEAARANLITLLNKTGHTQEAEQQFNLGTRLLREVGRDSSTLLVQAWRGTPVNTSPATPASVPVPQKKSVSVIGRDRELSNLRSVLQGLRKEKAAIITGAPGIGKSHLLKGLSINDEDALVLSARAFESEQMRPFGIWLDALSELDDPAKLLDPTNQDRERLLDSMSQLINEEAGNRQVILLFDDLHWGDESSLAALHYILRSSKRLPVHAVITARHEEMRDNSALIRVVRELKREDLLIDVRLGPLDEKSLSNLIEQRYKDVDTSELVSRCNGNPLFALELARALDSGSISDSMDDLIHERLHQFDIEGEDVLQWSAVINPRINAGAISQASGIARERVEEVLTVAQQEGILTDEPPFLEFSHDLIARGIYDRISPARQKNMHRVIATQMGNQHSLALDHVADLAHHAVQSGDASLAASAMISAGKLCLRFFANNDARALATQGLTWAEEMIGPESVNLTIELHEIIMSAGNLENWESLIDEYVRLAERALDNGAYKHAQLGYFMASYQRWIHGDWNSAREETLQAERVTRGGSTEEHINGLAETGKCLAMIERDLPKADAMLMEASALAQRERISNIALSIGRGILMFHESRMDEADDLFREAESLCRTAGDRISEFLALEYLVMIAIERSSYDEARKLCAKLGDIGERLDGSERPCARALTALLEYEGRDSDDALMTALEELRIADAKHRLAYVLNRAALIDIDRDRPEQAASRVSEALAYASLLEKNSESLISRIVLARTESTKARKEHLKEIEHLATQPVAAWAMDRLSLLEEPA